MWSAGCVLAFLLLGDHLFSGENEYEMVRYLDYLCFLITTSLLLYLALLLLHVSDHQVIVTADKSPTPHSLN